MNMIPLVNGDYITTAEELKLFMKDTLSSSKHEDLFNLLSSRHDVILVNKTHSNLKSNGFKSYECVMLDVVLYQVKVSLHRLDNTKDRIGEDAAIILSLKHISYPDKMFSSERYAVTYHISAEYATTCNAIWRKYIIDEALANIQKKS